MILCPLCNNHVSKLHKRSHIIPEWLYKGVYDKNHKMISVEIETEERLGKKQKGYYSEIICSSCEETSQKFDHYASLILANGTPSIPEKIAVRKKEYKSGKLSYERWENVDFLKFQKFVFACILRAHITQQKEGESLITERHFSRIKNSYLDPSGIDDDSYPISLFRLLDDGYETLMYLPFKKKINGHHVIEFVGAKYLFMLHVSNHMKPRHINNIRLKKDGSLFVPHTHMQELGTFRAAAPTLIDLASKHIL